MKRASLERLRAEIAEELGKMDTEKTEDVFKTEFLMGDAEPGTDTTVNRALVIFNHGKGWVALWSAQQGINDLVRECGGSDTFYLDAAGFDYEDVKGPRIVIGDIETFDDGPGDWPGSREVGLRFTNVRDVTPQEWADFIVGDWPWDLHAPVQNSSEPAAD